MMTKTRTFPTALAVLGVMLLSVSSYGAQSFDSNRAIPISDYRLVGTCALLANAAGTTAAPPAGSAAAQNLANASADAALAAFTNDALASSSSGLSEQTIIPEASLNLPIAAVKPHHGLLDILNVAPQQHHLLSVAYLADYVVADKEANFILTGGSDDACQIWLNGTQVLSVPHGRQLSRADIVPLALKQGTNMFLFKVGQNRGAWGLCYWLCPADTYSLQEFPSAFYEDFQQAALMSLTLTNAHDRYDVKVTRYLMNGYLREVAASGDFDTGIQMLRDMCGTLTNHPNAFSVVVYALRTLEAQKAANARSKPYCGLEALENAAAALISSSTGAVAQMPSPLFNSLTTTPGIAFARSPQAARDLWSASYPGLGLPLDDFAKAFPPHNPLGYSIAELASFASKRGLEAATVKLTYDQLEALLSNGISAICYLPSAREGQGHFIAVRELGDQANQLYRASRRDRTYFRDPAALRARWNGVALVLSTDDELKADPTRQALWQNVLTDTIPQSEAQKYIGGCEELDCGTGDDGGGDMGEQSESCSSCGGSGGDISAFPTYKIRRNDFILRLWITPLAYRPDGHTRLPFTLTYSSYQETPARHLGQRWSLDLDTPPPQEPRPSNITLVDGSKGLIETVELRSNAVVTVRRDDSLPDRPIREVVDQHGRASVFTYSDDGKHVTAITDPFGRATHFTYDDDGFLSTIENPAGQVTRFAYDHRGRVTTVVTPSGTNRFEYSDDKYGIAQAIRYHDALDAVETYRWTPDGFHFTDRVGNKWYYERALVEHYALEWARTSKIYKNGKLIEVSDYSRDSKLRFRARRRFGVWNSVAYQYNADGDLVATVDSFGRAQRTGRERLARELVPGDSSLPDDGTPPDDGSGKPPIRIMSDPEWYDHIEAETNGLGYITKYYYNADDDLVGIEDALSRTTRYYYSDGYLTAIHLPDDSYISNCYDTLGRVVKTIYPSGVEIGTTYDSIDRPLQTIYLSETAAPGCPSIDGHPFTATRYGCCGATMFFDRTGRATTYDYDPYGRLSSVTDANGDTVRYFYDKYSAITNLTDANGNATIFSHGDFGLYGDISRVLTSIRFPNGATRTYSYSEISSYPFIDENYFIAIVDTNSGNIYYESGRTAGFYNVDIGNQYHFLTDLGTYDEEDNKITLLVRKAGNLHIASPYWCVTNDNDYAVLWGYQVQVTDESGSTMDYSYSLDGALFEFDNGASKLRYNLFENQNLSFSTDNNAGNEIGFVYDQAGQLIWQTNNLLSVASTLNYAYDQVGNRTQMTVRAGSSLPGSLLADVYYSYDILDRLVEVTNVTDTVGCTYTYSYPAGNLTAANYNNGVRTEYAYDSIGRLTNLQHVGASGILEAYRYGYGPAQMISNITRGVSGGQAAMNFAYDNTYQLTGEMGRYLTSTFGYAAVVTSNRFAYDRAGNRLSLASTAPSIHAPKIYAYTVDNQLTGVVWNASKITFGGTVDNAWTVEWVKVKQTTAGSWIAADMVCQRGTDVRWTARDVPVTGSGQVTFQVIAQTPDDQTVTQSVSYTKTWSGSGGVTYVYDLNGNRTLRWEQATTRYTSYEYDDFNQLTRIREWSNSTAQFDYQYQYDLFGRRVKAIEGGVSRYFVYDGLDVVAELRNGWSLNRNYTRGLGLGGGIGDIVALSSNQGALAEYLSYNHRGDVVLLTTNDGSVCLRQEYTAFGRPVQWNPSGVAWNRRPGFSSKEYDSGSGLSYYGYRHYDPGTGAWMKKDPILWYGGLNVYMFSDNSPIAANDAYGLNPLAPVIADPAVGDKIVEGTLIVTAFLVSAVGLSEFIDYLRNLPAMRAPGDCTIEEYGTYQLSVEIFCNQPRRCDHLTPKDQLMTRYYINLACAGAREAINQACFRGGDPNHRNEAQKARNAAAKCLALLPQW